jgi:hypothetical protein
MTLPAETAKAILPHSLKDRGLPMKNPLALAFSVVFLRTTAGG